MKKIFVIAALVATHFSTQLFAQGTKPSSLTSLLNSYYNVKNALVASSSADAAASAAGFVKALSTVDTAAIPAPEMTAFTSLQKKLNFDAGHISESKDIAHQREHFTNFSANFYKLAKAVKLTDQPIYYDYCPMKKSYWLSASAAVKNPYYGSQMMTCGKVSETLNK